MGARLGAGCLYCKQAVLTHDKRATESKLFGSSLSVMSGTDKNN